MSEINFRRRGELVRGVFSILIENPDGLPVKTVLTKLEKSVPPTVFESRDYPSQPGRRRYENIVRFSTIRHVKAGWMQKKKGQWLITDAGRSAYDQFREPERFDREVTRRYRAWKQQRPDPSNDEVEDESIQARTVLEEAEENAWGEIEKHLQEINPYDFQQMVAALLEAMGYHVSWISPPGPDKGLDIFAHTDPLGITGPRIKVQVKRRQDKITVDGIRSFIAVLGDSDVGIFVNTGGFTKDAEIEARGQEKRRLTLIDLEKLFDLWVEHYDNLSQDSKNLLPLRPVYYLAVGDQT